MANQKAGNLCSRCGKPRVVVSSYQEKINATFVTYTTMCCPDPECQKLVDKVLLKEDEKRKVVKLEQDRREVERKIRLSEAAKSRLPANKKK